MADLEIFRANPNPYGKDRPPYGAPSNEQLNNEWMEFRNASGRSLDISGVILRHTTFDSGCHVTGRGEVTSFNAGTLEPGQSIRVHTGTGPGRWEGSVYHSHADRSNYVWNNRCGDEAQLTLRGSILDYASYAMNPSEGRVLQRVPGTNRLS